MVDKPAKARRGDARRYAHPAKPHRGAAAGTGARAVIVTGKGDVPAHRDASGHLHRVQWESAQLRLRLTGACCQQDGNERHHPAAHGGAS